MASGGYGPLRSGSSALWAHVLAKDTPNPPSAEAVPILPPLAPLDKTGTTMRVLLHDTQTNFEKFSLQVEKLIENIKETKQEINLTSTLIERGHGSLMGEIVDLVNRNQTQIQKSLGSPAQSSTVDTFFKTVGMRLEGLDQRLDAMQAFNQTQSQALQTQMQAIQNLHTQQTAILASVVPLLPLIQAIPLHLESLKTVSHVLSVPETPDKSTPGPLVSDKPSSKSPIHSMKRLHGESDLQGLASSQNVSASQRKKRRIGDPRLDINMQMPSPPSLQRQLFLSCSPSVNSANSAELPSSTVDPDAIETYCLKRQPSTTATPRRPLQEIAIVSGSKSMALKTAQMPIHNQQGLSSPSVVRGVVSPSFMEITPSAHRPPRILRVHSSIVGSSNATVRARDLVAGTSAPSRPSNHSARSLLRQHSVNPSIPVTNRSNASTVLASVTSSALASTPDSTSLPETVITTSNPLPSASIPPMQHLGLPGFFNTSHYKPNNSNFKPKERRSPIKEGRRFIPLVDTDDEDEDD